MRKHYNLKSSKRKNIAKSAVDLVTTIIASFCNVIISLLGFIASIVEE